MKKTIRIATLLSLVALPAMAQVASEHPGATSSAGMPQLDFGNPWTIAQVVWMLIIFGALYYVMARYALPQVEGVLAARRARIEGDLETAQAAKQRADAAMAEHQAATARARAEAQAAINAATQKAQAEAATRAEALNAKLAAQIAAAETQIATARDNAMGALRQVATDTADALVTRLIGQGDSAGVAAAVDRELAARGQA
ncbi:F0F1 ATP synthase subunit B family protein [Belnapia rosea]|uniref:ATP synthase subunit b n=1 Tax=Belnapia rosea TaxID=938405 RepID=A0A1G6V215_9PROT|nr:F0F1 ATP synthase subunit B' [Belnapia rosea]SDD47650.1 F-type H+-transporting ATPase subunit b [Belnapia rosea]